MRHESVWLATAETPRFGPVAGAEDADVVVVGGGITGLTTALLAARDGARVAVVEAARIASGTSGRTTGKVTSQHGLAYARLEREHGAERARLYAEANQRGVETVASLAADLGIDCDLHRAPAYCYAEGDDARQPVTEEAAAAGRLGLPAAMADVTELPFAVAAAVRFEDQVLLHPGRYLAGLARSASAAGVRIFEDSRVTDLDERGGGVEVTTAGGRVRAERAVVATLLPIKAIGGFFARAPPTRAYGLAARLRTPAPPGMYLAASGPSRSLRPWPGAGPNGLIAVGEGHPTGEEPRTEDRYEALEAWLRASFEVESVDYRWSAQDYTTVDSVPYVGRSPLLDRTLVATGFGKWGLSGGTAAAIMLGDLIAGRDNPWLDLFDARRVGDARAVGRLLKENVLVGGRWLADRLGRLRPDDLGHLGPGEASVVEVDGRAVGAYRHPDGRVEAVSVACSHMGCDVRWNGAERSWDCPCHGSRFATDGRVLDGPAVEPLDPVIVERA